MVSVGTRELRNNTRAVLDRVEAGEEITITIDGRPVALVVPIGPRPRFVNTEKFFRSLQRADPALRDDLRDLLGGETTDDLTW